MTSSELLTMLDVGPKVWLGHRRVLWRGRSVPESAIKLLGRVLVDGGVGRDSGRHHGPGLVYAVYLPGCDAVKFGCTAYPLHERLGFYRRAEQPPKVADGIVSTPQLLAAAPAADKVDVELFICKAAKSINRECSRSDAAAGWLRDPEARVLADRKCESLHEAEGTCAAVQALSRAMRTCLASGGYVTPGEVRSWPDKSWSISLRVENSRSQVVAVETKCYT